MLQKGRVDNIIRKGPVDGVRKLRRTLPLR